MHRSSLALIVGSHVAVDFHQGAVPAMLPFLVVARDYSYAAVTGITLAATLLSSLVQPAFGALTDRRPMPWLIAAGPLVAGAGIGLSGVGEAYAFTWAAIALSGIGVAAYHPEAARSARLASGGTARGMSYFSVAGIVGIASAPLLVAPVLGTFDVTATPLLAIPAACAAAVLVPALLWMRRRRLRAGPRKAPTPVDRPDDWRSFGFLTSAVIARSILYFGLISFVALYLIHELDASTAVGSVALATFIASGSVGALIGGALADRFGRVRTLRIGYLGAVPGLLGLVLAPNLPVAFVVVALLGLASFLPFAVQVTLGQEYLPHRVGTASGVTLGLAMSIGGLAAPLFGMLADAYDLRVALTVLVAFPLVSLLLTTRLRDVRTV